MDNAARARGATVATQRDRLLRGRELGTVSKDTTDEDINRYATNLGYHNQAMHLLHNPPTSAAFNVFNNAIIEKQHPKGSTHTAKFGDMRKSTAKQRGKNTGLTNAASLHHLGEGKDNGDEYARAVQESLNTEQPPTADEVAVQYAMDISKAIEESEHQRNTALAMVPVGVPPPPPLPPVSAGRRAAWAASAIVPAGVPPPLASAMPPSFAVRPYGVTPPYHTLGTTPSIKAINDVQDDPTPSAIVEVRDEGMVQLVDMPDSDESDDDEAVAKPIDPENVKPKNEKHLAVLVQKSLTKPYDSNIIRANENLVKEGKNPKQRVKQLTTLQKKFSKADK